jgi:hypothetical protein
VRHRRAEHGHHRITDELLQRAAVLLAALLRLAMVDLQDIANVFGVGSP